MLALKIIGAIVLLYAIVDGIFWLAGARGD